MSVMNSMLFRDGEAEVAAAELVGDAAEITDRIDANRILGLATRTVKTLSPLSATWTIDAGLKAARDISTARNSS
ncbi:MAG: hypothetical protein MZU91_00410 [Desulfosudis oleivorans]|nr:hypothetical protein [Desulfosudis oleivorans]